MTTLALHDMHTGRGARFTSINGSETVRDYGDALAEYRALHDGIGILDLSFRSRICLLGVDRQKFLNGQVTNNVKDLRPGEGCYAALITAKGRMQSDLRVFCLDEEILLDFEPGLAQTVTQRLEKYIIADDVQIVDVAPHFGLLSVQGPRAAELVAALNWNATIPSFGHLKVTDATLGEFYLANDARLGTTGFDFYLPIASMGMAVEFLANHALALDALWCGWDAFEMARIEQGIPRFGVDMDETNLPPEAGLERTAVSYTKGCYIGQEVIARIRTYGQVAKKLCRLELNGCAEIPGKGSKLFFKGKEAGYITSATRLPSATTVGMGYVRREANQSGVELFIGSSGEPHGRAIILAPV